MATWLIVWLCVDSMSAISATTFDTSRSRNLRSSQKTCSSEVKVGPPSSMARPPAPLALEPAPALTPVPLLLLASLGGSPAHTVGMPRLESVVEESTQAGHGNCTALDFVGSDQHNQHSPQVALAVVQCLQRPAIHQRFRRLRR